MDILYVLLVCAQTQRIIWPRVRLKLLICQTSPGCDVLATSSLTPEAIIGFGDAALDRRHGPVV